MDFSSVLDGFGVVFSPEALAYCLLGVTLGMLVGVLPGLGPAATIAILLPITYSIDATDAIIMLAGIFYGAQYGGTITAVLLRLPGEASSVVTAIDGYELARKGRAGAALGIAAIGSFIGATVAIIALTFVAPAVANFALDFGPAEYTVLALLGILMVSTLGTGAARKSILMATVGLLLATIGQDPVVGVSRLTFGVDNLLDGIDFVVVAMGIFGVGEILYNLEQVRRGGGRLVSYGSVYPTRSDFKASRGAIGRGSVVGFLLGILPGGGATMSSMAAYAVEKRATKNPELFGHGAIQGVAGPETANNAGATSSFIPLLTLGIPANATMAVMFGALKLQGITPGPLVVNQHPDLFWGVINSMYVGNLLLLAMSLPLIGVFVRILKIRPAILAPLTILVTMIGVYSIRSNVFDMYLVVGLGILGYLLKKTGFEPGPLVLAFVLGGILESSFRRAMLTFGGDPTGFLRQPIAATLLAVLVIVLVIMPIGRRLMRRRSDNDVVATG